MSSKKRSTSTKNTKLTDHTSSNKENTELVKGLTGIGVGFRVSRPLFKKPGFGNKTIPFGVVIRLDDKKDREKVIAFLDGFSLISIWNEVLPQYINMRR